METANQALPPPQTKSVFSILKRFITWWLTPRSDEPEDQFREKTLRGIVLFFGAVMAVLMTALALSSLSSPLGAPNKTLMQMAIVEITLIAVGLSIQFRRLMLGSVFVIVLFFGMAFWTNILSGYWVSETYLLFSTGFALGVFLLPTRKYPTLIMSTLLFILMMALVAPKDQLRLMQQLAVAGKITNGPTLDEWFFPVAMAGWVGFISTLFVYYVKEFERRRQSLDDLIDTLEERVSNRTRDLQIAAQVATQITTVLDLDNLLPQIVNLTRTGFELYHVSVFLYDDETRQLRYEAGTGEAGQLMKERDKKFQLEDTGLVPQAARTRQAVRVGDVTTSPDYYQEKSLPRTKSELAVPMVVGETLIGVLDLQSEEVGSFTDDDMTAIQPLAKQISVAVQNARLYAYQREIAEQLRAVDDMKSQFLASMSHELRTPLNAILSFSKFIKMGVYGDTSDQQVDAVQKIIGSADHLLALINDVLDITKIESGMMQLFVEDDIDLSQELATVVSTATILVEHKDVNIVEDIDAELPLMVGDRRRVRQIFLNIVSNACKFTEQGSVTISAKRKGDELLFVVIDTGPGIPADSLEFIFEPFQQTSTGIKHAGGTGLGLPITKKLVEAHEGSLSVETEVGTGSSFFVRMPLQSKTLRAMMEMPERMEV